MKSQPTYYTGFRGSKMTKEEKIGTDHLFDMMVAAKQQIIFRNVLKKREETNNKG